MRDSVDATYLPTFINDPIISIALLNQVVFCLQVSFSGCLIENLNNLADNNHIYSSGWNNAYSGAINSMKTSGGDPKLDFVSFTYHHALTTLIDR